MDELVLSLCEDDEPSLDSARDLLERADAYAQFGNVANALVILNALTSAIATQYAAIDANGLDELWVVLEQSWSTAIACCDDYGLMKSTFVHLAKHRQVMQPILTEPCRALKSRIESFRESKKRKLN